MSGERRVVVGEWRSIDFLAEFFLKGYPISLEIREYLIKMFLILEIKYPKSMEVDPKYRTNSIENLYNLNDG